MPIVWKTGARKEGYDVRFHVITWNLEGVKRDESNLVAYRFDIILLLPNDALDLLFRCFWLLFGFLRSWSLL